MAKSNRQILINEADFDLIKSNLKKFLNEDPKSPFYQKNYNYESSALSGILDTCAYLIHHLSYTLNKNISEMFMDTVTIEDNIYSLLNNYNYTPQLKRPANTFMKIRYFRCTYITLTMASVAGFTVGDTVTGSGSGATGTIHKIDTVNLLLYLIDTGFPVFAAPENITNGTVTRACTTVTTDKEAADENKDFIISWNKAKYTDDFYIIPTFRDKIQESYYDDANVNDFYDKNIISYQIEPYVEGYYRYLQVMLSVYQADWTSQEQTIDANFVTSPKIRLDDSLGDSYNDKVIIDSIRVFVDEGGAGTWIEYNDIKRGIVNESQTQFNGGKIFSTKYVPDDGVYVNFNISYISRNLVVGDKVRVYYAVTEGDEINEISGTNEFTNEDFQNITIIDNTDPLLPISIFDSNNYGAVIASGTEDYYDASLIMDDDVNAALDVLDNGQERQDLESIQETAPLYYSTQGRAVTENDYNAIFRTHFSEYLDVLCWGGDREFLDVENIMTTAITWHFTTYGVYPTTALQLATTLKYAQELYYTEGELSIDTVASAGIETGKYIKDVGHVYFTLINQNFRFVDDSGTIDQIKLFFDQYKVLTLFMKYMPPTILFLQPTYTCKVSPEYAGSIDVNDIKQQLFDDFNNESKFNRVVYFSDINDILRGYDEIDSIISYNYNAKVKIKNSDDADDWIYVRTYTKFSGDISTTLETDSGNFTFETIGTDVKISGLSVGTCNPDLGLIKFRNRDGGGSQFFTDSYFYIEDISFTGFKINSVKDCFLSFESKSDITIVLI